MAEKKKRTRQPDYSNVEKSKIIELFVQHNDFLNAKLDNTVTAKAKNQQYKEICEKVNSVGGNNRTLESIKNNWQTIKKLVKGKASNFFAAVKRSVRKTGGGEGEIETEQKIEDVLTEEELMVYHVIPHENMEGEQ